VRKRIHYLDTLKVAIVYGIILYHAALPFTLTSWLISNPDKSYVLSGLAAFAFPWGIPMMFLLAGADSWFSLRSHSVAAFVRARFLRLVLPLAAGIVLLSPMQWYLSTVTDRSVDGMLQSYPAYFRGVRLSWTPEWLGRYGYHLWFLGYLFAISVLVLPVLVVLGRPLGRRAVAAAAAGFQRPGAIYLFALPLVASQVALRHRFPAYQDWADIATYLLVFVAGYVLASERRLEVAIRASGRLALAVGIVSPGGVGALGLLVVSHPGAQAPLVLVYGVLWALMVWSWIVVVLNVGIRWLDFGNRVTGYLAESILPVYVLSHPIVVIVASGVVSLPLGVWSKFALVGATSLLASVALYEFVVRRWAPARLVFGLKRPPRVGTWPDGDAAWPLDHDLPAERGAT
jgi:glucan biosynthesis protein C